MMHCVTSDRGSYVTSTALLYSMIRFLQYRNKNRMVTSRTCRVITESWFIVWHLMEAHSLNPREGGGQFLDSTILFVSMDAEIRNTEESYSTEAEP